MNAQLRALFLMLFLGILALGATLSLSAQQTGTKPGDPLPNLTSRQFAEFRLGLEDFLEVETADDGLGPAFNGTSCAACHRAAPTSPCSSATTRRCRKSSPTKSSRSTLSVFHPKNAH